VKEVGQLSDTMLGWGATSDATNAKLVYLEPIREGWTSGLPRSDQVDDVTSPHRTS
jgi:hypothetical protein